MSSIQINNVTKRFGDFTAVEDLSLDIEEGEFVALLGPSGCGKTTTMNMIANRMPGMMPAKNSFPIETSAVTP